MKTQDIESLRKMDEKKLRERLEEETKELVNLKLKLKKGELKNIRAPKNIRINIATIKTLLSEKKLIAEAKEAK